MYTKKSAFTLVELIVVITILAILATIGFVSFSGYLAGTRDTNRIAQIKAMSDALELYSTKKSLPIPDDKIDIQASGTTIAYQGYIGKNVLETIEYTEAGLDPKDKQYFSYYLTKNKKYYQLLALLEEESDDVLVQNSPLLRKEGLRVVAADYSERFPKVQGKKLGILTDDKNVPVQEIEAITASGYIDILNTTDEYIANIGITQITGTGILLGALEGLANLGGNLTKAKGKSCKEIIDTYGQLVDGIYVINPDGKGEISVYCDMTTDGGGWTMVVRAVAGMVLHRTTSAIGSLISPKQLIVSKLSSKNIIKIGKTNGGYVTRFTYDNFSKKVFHQWNNGYALDFENRKLVSGDGGFKQTRKDTVSGEWVNELINYSVGCGGSYSPFTSNSACATSWAYGTTNCHTGFGLGANCGNRWTEGHMEDINHRNGVLWIR